MPVEGPAAPGGRRQSLRLWWSEGKLLAASHWTRVLLAVLVLLLLWAEMGTYRAALNQEADIEYVYRASGGEDASEEALRSFARSHPDARTQREAIWGLHPATGANRTLAVLGALGPMVLAVWSAHWVGAEYGWRTAAVRAAHTGWRRVLGARLAWIVLASGLVSVAVAGVGSLAARISWPLLVASSRFAAWLDPPDLGIAAGRQVLAVAAGMAVYGLMAATVAVMTRSALAGALAGLVVPNLEVLLAGRSPLLWMLPWGLHAGLLTDHLVYLWGGFAGAPPFAPPAPGPEWRWVGCLLWMLVWSGLTLGWSGRQEIR
ncbi:MAG: hypothetical protein RDU89_11315 [bacterium]|nr:hypothetical protein [bacterium]